ncbi:ABC transporter ATP-binding protein [Motilimonas eburnea]|uniref:ABC transporter ATP-binding protein n=1 Tax=Motilimonas eburnea TaxID=1737488 RepID=UPI001E3A22D4|nr:ABC transporter ATP-binding protein [Motilimonas eburnea]MCE2571932.1 ABC transporter ATP-binding protein/permease [Motilimonas eburnea]
MVLNASSQFSWQSIFNAAKAYKKEIIIANVVAILATLASVPVPLLMPLMVDEVLLNTPGTAIEVMDQILPAQWQGPVGYIVCVLLFTVFLRTLSVALTVLQSRQFTIIAKHITFLIRQVLVKQMRLIAIREYENLGSGSLSSHFVTDVETLDKFIGDTLSRFLVSLLAVLGTAAILLWLNWQLGLFILLLNPVVIFFSTKLGSKVKHLKRNENSAFELFQQAVVETLDGIYEIRAANKERHYINRIIDRAKGLRNSAIDYSWRSEAAGRASFLIFLIGFEVFRAVAMIMVLFTDLTVGEIFAVFGYLWFMMGPVQELLNMQYSYFAASASLKRLNSVLALSVEPDLPAQQSPFTQTSELALSLRDLHFSYNEEVEVIRGISLDIQPGEKVAFVGASGGGKSTLVQLLLGLYPLNHGEILFNGVNVNQCGFELIRSHTATVLQSPCLFNDNIRNNLTLGEEVTDDRIWQALKIAQLDDFVRALDEQLDTQVGQRGVKLSGGQKQRIAIARMVLSDPKLVIMDEATSALDTQTEANLHLALTDFLKDRTTIIVAHRLSSVKQADRIFVFEDGKISQTGQHAALVNQPGLYQSLYGNH